METCPVSVVIPTYNRAAMVRQAIDSVLVAVAPGDEVIVVDDGSTDNTEQALAAYGPKIRYEKIPNSGPSGARNHGVQTATHDLIAFLDSDDVWLPHRLTLGRQLMHARPDLLYCFSNFGGLNEDGSIGYDALGSWRMGYGLVRRPDWDAVLGAAEPFSRFGELPPGYPDFGVHFGYLYPSQLEFSFIPAITLLVRRGAAGTALHFPEDIRWAEDWECFARLGRAGLGAYMDCETARQRVHSGERLTAASEGEKAAIMLKIFERLWGSDPDFLAQHRERYRRAISSARLKLARALIVQGRTSEARIQLKLAGEVPLSYRALSILPGSLTRNILSVRRALVG